MLKRKINRVRHSLKVMMLPGDAGVPAKRKWMRSNNAPTGETGGGVLFIRQSSAASPSGCGADDRQAGEGLALAAWEGEHQFGGGLC